MDLVSLRNEFATSAEWDHIVHTNLVFWRDGIQFNIFFWKNENQKWIFFSNNIQRVLFGKKF